MWGQLRYPPHRSECGDSRPRLSIGQSPNLAEKSPERSPCHSEPGDSLEPPPSGAEGEPTLSCRTPSGSVPPTGKVNFSWGRYSIGSAILNASGAASLTRSNLNADAYPLVAAYVGDANSLASTSAVLNQVVTETTSATTLTSSPNPSTVGQAVTFTAVTAKYYGDSNISGSSASVTETVQP
ncbi:MAG: Ig-like domain-containing protein [Candidatus Sulfotelmatobacter sp.]